MLSRFFEYTLKHRKAVVIIFAVLSAIAAVFSRIVTVDYDLVGYLPKDSPSTVAMGVAARAFGKELPNARVIVKDISIADALEYKDRLSRIDGINGVIWLDDAADLDQPVEMIDEKTIGAWYKNGIALFAVTIDNGHTVEAVNAVRKLLGGRGAIAGNAASIADAQESTRKEVNTMILYIVPVILGILLITTSSWFEPVLFLLSIGVAVLLNNGTNVFLGRISYITHATSSVLLLAVSMDYSIFLLHRFAGFREEGYDATAAMLKAINKSFSTILGSAFTTMLGFIALTFMRFGLGPDLGTVIAKGITFSLLSVFLFLPSVTVMTYGLIEKTRHKPFIPSFDALAKAVLRVMVPVAVLAGLTILPAFLAQRQNRFVYGATADESAGGYRDGYEIEKLFGKANTAVLLVPSGDSAREKMLSEDLYKIPWITSVISYSQTVGNRVPVEFLPQESLKNMISGGYSRIVVTAGTDPECEESFGTVKRIRQTAEEHYGRDYFLMGESVSIYDMKDTVIRDNAVVTTAGMIGIGLVIMFTFRSVLIPVLLLLAIQSSVWINLGVPYFLDKELAYTGYMIISSVQLGTTVDYAILYANRYIENRTWLNKRDALAKTIKDTAASVLTSAGILTVSGLGIGVISASRLVGEFGMLLGRGAALSALTVLFFLPALIYMADSLIPKTSLGVKFPT